MLQVLERLVATFNADDSFFLTERGAGRFPRRQRQTHGAVLPKPSVQQLQRPGRAVWGEWVLSAVTVWTQRY